ncbi:hypothetical protein SAMN05216387_103270 [Nitrosovibrio tenuis]|uniref:Uncharacterized protein n=1 Tax=Nitrosovibrio tenuis TaxID=1233 RepID=A0A1H7KM73_9PROT|nr:hypothetical protein SAMN05216387_103270 [Nitrosovibrio tenuis]
MWGARIPLRGRTFQWKALLRPAWSRPEALPEGPAKRDRAAEGMPDRGYVLCGALASHCGVAPSSGRHCSALRGRAPKRCPRGPRSGIGQRRGCLIAGMCYVGRSHPTAGSHLPVEGTAPPCVVAPRSVARGARRSRVQGIYLRAWRNGPRCV